MHCGGAWALDYINVTPVGSQFPEWDGGPTELEFADINADGHSDLLSIGDHGSPYINTNQHGVIVYFSDGAGGWSIHMEGNFGYGGIAIGDVNNDGSLDVGYGMHHNYSGSDFGDQLIEVALGDGSGTAWIPWDDGLATNGEDWGMFATDFADFDNDGDLDLASGSFGCCNGVHVYRNNGDGSWTQTWARTGGNSRSQLCCGDVNADGFPDIAAGYQNGTIFLGDGSGSFMQADTGLPSAGTVGFEGVALGDVDGDGCADLSFTRSGGVYVYLWREDHWIDSSTGLPPSGGYDITQLWDMNLDGWVDVVAAGSGTCSIWLGDGAGSWADGGGFYHGPADGTEAMRVGGDLDHNGYPDIALVQEEGSWPNTRNYLRVYQEATLPATRLAALQFPRGNESFYIGSVQTIRWSTAHVGDTPATIDLDYSPAGPGGPWSAIASGLSDSGHFQWTLPGPISLQACVKVTLHQGGEDAEAISRAFQVMSADPQALTPDACSTHWSTPGLRVSPNPSSGTFALRISHQGFGQVERADRGAFWTLMIHEPTGRLVRRMHVPTAITTSWDCCDAFGRRLPPGIYLARLTSADGSRVGRTQHLVLVR
jgi:hypothetical protein